MDTDVIKLSHKNFYGICRICYEQNDLKDIFRSTCKEVTFARILENITNDKLLEMDGLSPYVCLNCLKYLLQFKAFLDQYKISAETLKSIHNYLYKGENTANLDGRNYMQIPRTKFPAIETLLKDCTFANLVSREESSEDSNYHLPDRVKEEQIETLIIKNELNNDCCLENPSLFDLPTSLAPSKNSKFKCTECNGIFKSPGGLSRHRNSDHSHVAKPNEEFLCAICNHSYSMKYKLRRHLTVSHRQSTCDKCGLKLKRSSLTKHLKMHEPDYKPYKPPRNRRLCTVCGKNIRYNFNAHVRNHQELSKGLHFVKGMLQCNSCSFETPHWTSLYRHKLRHKEKPFLCNTCGKDFSGKDVFDKHLKLHEPYDRPTSCYVCSETFLNEFDYCKHLSTHTYYVRKLTNLEEYLKRKQKYKKRAPKTPINEENPPKPKRIPNPAMRKVKTTYKCEPCNKIFNDNAHLQIHVTAIHDNKREHKCLYCGKGFNLPNSLQEHIRTHTGDTIKCDYCEKTFKQNSTRYKHLREAHNVHLGQIRKEKSKERREKDDIRKAYKKLKMKV